MLRTIKQLDRLSELRDAVIKSHSIPARLPYICEVGLYTNPGIRLAALELREFAIDHVETFRRASVNPPVDLRSAVVNSRKSTAYLLSRSSNTTAYLTVQFPSPGVASTDNPGYSAVGVLSLADKFSNTIGNLREALSSFKDVNIGSALGTYISLVYPRPKSADQEQHNFTYNRFFASNNSCLGDAYDSLRAASTAIGAEKSPGPATISKDLFV